MSNSTPKICEDIGDLTDEVFSEITAQAQEMAEYHHPLKHVRAAELRKQGQRDLQIIHKLKEIRDLLNEV